jgi:hypothetical protein
VRIGRNVKIAGDVKANDFGSRMVKSGSSVEPGGAKRRAKAAAEKLLAVGLEPSAKDHREPLVVAGGRRAVAGAAPVED